MEDSNVCFTLIRQALVSILGFVLVLLVCLEGEKISVLPVILIRFTRILILFKSSNSLI